MGKTMEAHDKTMGHILEIQENMVTWPNGDLDELLFDGIVGNGGSKQGNIRASGYNTLQGTQEIRSEYHWSSMSF